MERNVDSPIVAGSARVNRIMRENKLLSPYRIEIKADKHEHDGRIITDNLNEMWATDGKKFWISGLWWHWFFGLIEHCNNEILAWHIAKRGTRFEAMEPIKSAVRNQFGSIDKDICS